MHRVKAPSDMPSHRFQGRIQARLRRDDNDCYSDTIKRINDKDDNKEEVTFEWVIGGHSPAAGNGNLFLQTYGYII